MANWGLSDLAGFSPIGDSKYSSDVNWGCMLRSSQMLVAQALLAFLFLIFIDILEYLIVCTNLPHLCRRLWFISWEDHGGNLQTR